MKGPTYRLELVKGLMKDNCWYLTGTARDDATEIGFDEEDVYDCIVNHLAETHFYKTMPAQKKAGLMQDVYRITYQDERLYIKLQVCGNVIVVSFKEED